MEQTYCFPFPLQVASPAAPLDIVRHSMPLNLFNLSIISISYQKRFYHTESIFSRFYCLVRGGRGDFVFHPAYRFISKQTFWERKPNKRTILFFIHCFKKGRLVKNGIVRLIQRAYTGRTMGICGRWLLLSRICCCTKHKVKTFLS